MPKIRGLTQKQREEQFVAGEIQRASQDFLRAVGMKRGLESKTYLQVAEDIGVSPLTLRRWRDGELSEANFGRVITAYAKMGFRLVPEQIADSRK